MSRLPEALLTGAFAERARVAVQAVESAGAALMRLRTTRFARAEVGDQLKTSADRGAEGWVVGFLEATFPADEFLSEEAFEDAQRPWHAPKAFWTVDALDGTRSFADGFDGFCVQVAWVEDGVVRVGVVHEPVSNRTYVGVVGAGAYRIDEDGAPRRLVVKRVPEWPRQPLFVDSTEPSAGRAGELYRKRGGRFLELGSIGLKLCRVCDSSAHVFAKAVRFKLWDVAPAQVIATEAGVAIGLWDGSPIPYDTERVQFRDILAAPPALFELAARDLSSSTSEV